MPVKCKDQNQLDNTVNSDFRGAAVLVCCSTKKTCTHGCVVDWACTGLRSTSADAVSATISCQGWGLR